MVGAVRYWQTVAASATQVEACREGARRAAGRYGELTGRVLVSAETAEPATLNLPSTITTVTACDHEDGRAGRQQVDGSLVCQMCGKKVIA